MWKFICKISLRHDVAEILLMLALHTNQSINHHRPFFRFPTYQKVTLFVLCEVSNLQKKHQTLFQKIFPIQHFLNTKFSLPFFRYTCSVLFAWQLYVNVQYCVYSLMLVLLPALLFQFNIKKLSKYGIISLNYISKTSKNILIQKRDDTPVS